LPDRYERKDVIDQMRRRFGHAPGVARGAYATTLARVGNHEIVLTLVTVGAGESIRDDAAFEITAQHEVSG